MSRAIVILSGGQDSTTCLYWAKQQFTNVGCVTIDYGQRHRRELHAASAIAGMAGVPIEIITLPGILKGTSPLVDKGANLEQYKDWKSLPGGLEKTFVPMRNMLFLTIAANRAICADARTLITGVCQEDFGGYPDCRLDFIVAAEAAIRLGTFLDTAEPFTISTPLMGLTKAESVALALSLPGCYPALGFSHTAYDGAYPPLGHDHATLLRAKGFEVAGVPDPLIVRAYWEMLMALPEAPNYDNYREPIQRLRPVFAQSGAMIALGALQQEFK